MMMATKHVVLRISHKYKNASFLKLNYRVLYTPIITSYFLLQIEIYIMLLMCHTWLKYERKEHSCFKELIQRFYPASYFCSVLG